jgi:hypothetical protein
MDVWTSPVLKPRSAAHVEDILFLTDTVRVLRDDGKGYKIEEEHIAIVTLKPGISEEAPRVAKAVWGEGGQQQAMADGFIIEGLTSDVLRCQQMWQNQNDLEIEDELLRAPPHRPQKHWARLWVTFAGTDWAIYAKQHALKMDIMQEKLQVTIGHTSQIRNRDSLIATTAGNPLWQYNAPTNGILWISKTTALLETAHPPETWCDILSEDAEKEDKICVIRWKKARKRAKSGPHHMHSCRMTA